MLSGYASQSLAHPPAAASSSGGSGALTAGAASAFIASGGGSRSSLFALVSTYVDRMLPADGSMKVLLVDRTTLPIISVSCSQTQLLSRGVFLVDEVAGGRQRRELKTMRCIVFIRPEAESVEAACTELQRAKYSAYSIVFCGAAGPEMLDRLARADAGMLVNQVEEVFADYCALNHDAFVLETAAPPHPLVSSLVSSGHVRRIAEGLAAMCVATRRRPLIRYQKSSPFVRRVLQELEAVFKRDPELYSYRVKADAVLLLLDRSEDPVTALLTPWTYQAMLHEHIGLEHNTLRLPEEVKGAEKEGYVFSEQSDPFFAESMFLNWGDLCCKVKTAVEQCKAALNLDRETATMEDIKQFIHKMPHTQNLTGSVAKHTTVVAHLSSIVQARNLLEISLLEQDIVASYNEGEHWTRLQALAGRVDVRDNDLLRLCLLFHLRYERAGSPSRTTPFLDRISSSHAQLPQKIRDLFGRDRPTDGLFAETGVMAKIVKTFVEAGNVYTQHQPVLRRTLLSLYGGRLDTSAYPYAASSAAAAPALASNAEGAREGPRPTDVTVYMCGGFTLEEAALVRAVNCGTAFKPSEVSVMGLTPGTALSCTLGGERVLNTQQFLDELHRMPTPQ